MQFLKRLDSEVKEWELGEICQIKSGVSFKAGEFQKEGIPVLEGSGIHDGKVIEDNIRFCEPDRKPQSDWIRFGDVVIVRCGSAGRVAINLTDTEFLFTESIFKLEPDPEILDKRYLYHFLLSCPDTIHSLTQGIIPRLNSSALKKLKIPVPSLEIQKEVSDKLDKFREIEREIEREIGLRQRQYEYYRDLLINVK